VVIEWRLTTADVARVRFAYSPLSELVLSLIVVRTPARHALHLRWIRTVRPLLDDLDLSELFALVPLDGIVADFLSPPPATVLSDFDAELDALRRTEPERILADMGDVPGLPPAAARRIRDDPVAAAHRIADNVQEYWTRAVAPVWPRIQTLLEADVLWRASRLAAGGAQALFDGLHDTISWREDRLEVSDPYDYRGTLSGEGLVLVPSAMAWPRVRKMVAPYQATLIYPVRGVGTLWETGRPQSPEALGALIGRTRAELLAALDAPGTTTGLARRFQLTPGAVSQHLAVLNRNGLVSRSRMDGSVLYWRTPRGDDLATGGPPGGASE
jgi:DNA-binding transcriptional ArsR family regulator